MKNLLSHLNPQTQAQLRSIGLLSQAHGMKAYLVGGPVRDLMLRGKSSVSIDLDITVEGNGLRLADSFAELHPGSQLTRYPAFKTATVQLLDGAQIDFATSRKETYARRGAYPAVKPSGIKDDLRRRDFTINAMALSINPDAWGELVDPLKGREDLAKKKIRIIHAKSFQDDATRILRAARFMARLGFTMEAQTLKSLKAALKIKVLDTIKPQRYLKDFNKILKEPKAQVAIKYLREWGAYKEIAD
jgi:tRNA nucleotidyltransferase (CCA-adding enzyme)